MTFPVVQTKNSGTNDNSGNSHIIQLPTGIQSGDLLLMFLGHKNANPGTITASGWTFLATTGTTNFLTVGYKTATGSEGTTVTVTTSNGSATAAQTYRISGAQAGAAPVQVSATGNSTTPDPPSSSPFWGSADTLWIAVGGTGPVMSAGPSGYSGFLNVGNTACNLGVAWLQQTAGTQDPGTFTTSGTDTWDAVTVAIQPSGPQTLPISASLAGAGGLKADATLISSYPYVEGIVTGTNDQNGASHTVQLPAGIKNGELLLLLIYCNNGNPGTVSAPGWSWLAPTSNGSSCYIVVGYKTGTGSEGSTVTVSTTNNIGCDFITYRISNCGTSTPPVQANATGSGNNTPDPPALSPVWGGANTLWIAFSGDGPDYNTPPTGFSGFIDTNNSQFSAGTAWLKQSTATEDPGNFTTNGSSSWNAVTIAIRPAGPITIAANAEFDGVGGFGANATVSSPFPTIEASTQGTSDNGATSHTVQLPAGITAGEMLLLFAGFTSNGDPGTVAASGFTFLPTTGNVSANVSYCAIGYKTATGSEGATVTLTTTNNQRGVFQTFRISNVNLQSPPEQAAVSGTSNTPDPPMLVPSWGQKNQLFFAITVNGQQVTATPTNYSGLIQSSNSTGWIGSVWRKLNATSDNPSAFTVQNSNNWNAVTLVLKQATTAWDGAAQFAGAGALITNPSPTHPIAASFASVGGFFNNISYYAAGTDLLIGTGSLTVNATFTLQLAGRFDGVGGFGVDTQHTSLGVSLFAGAGGLKVDATKGIVQQTAATFTGASNLLVDAIKGTPWQIAAEFDGVGQFQTSTMRFVPAAASMAAVGSFQNSGGTSLNISAVAIEAGAGNFIASASHTPNVAVNFNAVGSFAANANILDIDAAVFAGAGSFTANSIGLIQTSASFAGAGTLNVLAGELGKQFIDVQNFNGTGSFAATAILIAAAKSEVFDGIGSFKTIGTELALIAAEFDGASRFFVSGGVYSPTAANFNAVGGLFFSTIQTGTWQGASTLNGAGGFACAAGLVRPIAASFAGSSSLILDMILKGRPEGKALLAGDGDLFATTIYLGTIVQSFNGDGDLFAAVNKLPSPAQAAFAPAGNFKVDATVLDYVAPGNAEFDGTGALAVDGIILNAIWPASANLPGVGSLNVDATVLNYVADGAALLAGAGALNAQVTQVFYVADASALLTGTGALKADIARLLVNWPAAALAPITGSLNVNATVLLYVADGAAKFTAASSLAVDVTVLNAIWDGAAEFDGAGGIKAKLAVNATVSARFQPIGRLRVDATYVAAIHPQVFASALLGGTGKLTVGGGKKVIPDASLTGTVIDSKSMQGVATGQTSGLRGTVVY